MSKIRKYAGLIAALLLAATGSTLLVAGNPVIGGVLILVGAGAAAWQMRMLIHSREDPYDLSRLFDAPSPGEDRPEDDVAEEDDVPFCYHCGHAVAKPFTRCPECGATVR